jgi:hypothetical protein
MSGMGYSFKILKPYALIQASSLRTGGYSKGAFNSLNLGLSTGDDITDIKRNRLKFFKSFKFSAKQLAIAHQVHSNHISIVKKPGMYAQTDALITNIPGLILSVLTADCFPILMYDPVKNVCAVVHSGWRGTSLNITGKTVKTLIEKFGSNPKSIIAAIGAGIQQSSYQVDPVTAGNFDKKYLLADGPRHYRLDIQQNIITQLLDKGIEKENIEVDGRCTFQESALFYSYRRDGKLSGRMMSIIGIKKAV